MCAGRDVSDEKFRFVVRGAERRCGPEHRLRWRGRWEYIDLRDPGRWRRAGPYTYTRTRTDPDPDPDPDPNSGKQLSGRVRRRLELQP